MFQAEDWTITNVEPKDNQFLLNIANMFNKEEEFNNHEEPELTNQFLNFQV